MRSATLLLVCAGLLICVTPAAPSDSSSQELCSGLPLQDLLRQAAPRSFADASNAVPGTAHTAELADRALCSSISEPLVVIPEESSGFADRFCGLLRTELGRRSGEPREARLGAGEPDPAAPGFRSCDFFAQDGAVTISARAVYFLEPDHSTRLLVMVSAW